MASNAPSQVRTVDPFASYNSDQVNKLTRMITFGQDSLVSARSCDVSLDSTSTSQVILNEGVAYKDDVWIDITAQHTVNFNDQNHYYQFDIPSITTGYYYVVLSYIYQKQRPAPECEILILTPNQRYLYTYGGPWLFLKAVHVASVGPIVIDAVYDYDPDDTSNKRIYSRTYAGTEVTLPTFDDTRDPSRIVYSIEDDDYYFGLENGWSLPLSQVSSGSMLQINTTGFEVGDLIYITPAGNLGSANANLEASTADGGVASVGASGLIQTTGKLVNVKVENGINVSVGNLLYLSKTEPARVTNVQSSPVYQFVGRCIEIVDSTSVNMLFVRGEPGNTATSIYNTYVSDTLNAVDWNSSGGLYYQDVDISNISGVDTTVIVWDATSKYVIIPEDIEFVSTSIMRIWMSVNTLTLNVLAIGIAASSSVAQNVTTIHSSLPSGSWLGTGPYYQNIDITSFSTDDAVILVRDSGTNMAVNPTNIQFDSTNNIKIWMNVNTQSLEVTVVGPTSSTSSVTILTATLSSGASWVASGGSYYQDINVSSIGSNHAVLEFVDDATSEVVIPQDIQFVSSSIIRVWMPNNSRQLNVTIIG